ncbi:hypothetical protein [Laribacter hongkongensis]|uniref:Uncharacterized protein n=1 Tax=Laribacter hongkongensis (strain HLHK9) TaxID=557598 RepID=C1D872_LARHH|nr:hypothetical protein [Laribacter hongkongensis]ACO74662.1 hypothetical protein LHK_01677 [Laribacter hongkongensis HLHK9]
MAFEATRLTDEAIRELRAQGWTIKAPVFKNRKPVFLIVKPLN